MENELARITLNSIGDGVISIDLAGNITYLNPVAESMTGHGVNASACETFEGGDVTGSFSAQLAQLLQLPPVACGILIPNLLQANRESIIARNLMDCRAARVSVRGGSLRVEQQADAE